MRAVQLALLFFCIQFGLGIVAESGMFGNTVYFENTMTTANTPTNANALNDIEQSQVRLDVFSQIKNMLTWGWIKQFFYPAYQLDLGVQKFVDYIQSTLQAITLTVIIGAAAIEFYNRWGSVL